MTNITISNLDDDLQNQLQKRAEKHGHSLEQEITEILRLVLSENHQMYMIDLDGLILFYSLCKNKSI
jgi:plasmid stability protein